MGDFALDFCIEWEILEKSDAPVFLACDKPGRSCFFIFPMFWSCLLPIFMMDGGEAVPEQEEKKNKHQSMTAILFFYFCVFVFVLC